MHTIYDNLDGLIGKEVVYYGFGQAMDAVITGFELSSDDLTGSILLVALIELGESDAEQIHGLSSSTLGVNIATIKLK